MIKLIAVKRLDSRHAVAVYATGGQIRATRIGVRYNMDRRMKDLERAIWGQILRRFEDRLARDGKSLVISVRDWLVADPMFDPRDLDEFVREFT
jgi:hypothetical protein